MKIFCFHPQKQFVFFTTASNGISKTKTKTETTSLCCQLSFFVACLPTCLHDSCNNQSIVFGSKLQRPWKQMQTDKTQANEDTDREHIENVFTNLTTHAQHLDRKQPIFSSCKGFLHLLVTCLFAMYSCALESYITYRNDSLFWRLVNVIPILALFLALLLVSTSSWNTWPFSS